MENRIGIRGRGVRKGAGTKLLLAAGFVWMPALAGGCGRELELISEQAVAELGEEPETDAGRYVRLGEQEAAEAVTDFSGVDMNTVGVYPASVTYRGRTAVFEVLVQDTTAPVPGVKGHVTATAGTPLYASEIVTEMTEASGRADIFLEKQEDEEMLKGESFVRDGVLCTDGAVVYDETGEYELLVTAVDASGNAASVSVDVTVGEPPVFSGVGDLWIVEGDTDTDYLDGVTAVDYEGTDITDRIVCDAAAVDPSAAGAYEITYLVADAQGFHAKEQAVVTVERQKTAGKRREGKASASREEAARQETGGGSATDDGGVSAEAADGKAAEDSYTAAENGGAKGQVPGETSGQPPVQNPPAEASGGSAPGENAGSTDAGDAAAGGVAENEELPALEDLGFEEYVPEAGTGADDGTDLGGTSVWY